VVCFLSGQCTSAKLPVESIEYCTGEVLCQMMMECLEQELAVRMKDRSGLDVDDSSPYSTADGSTDCDTGDSSQELSRSDYTLNGQASAVAGQKVLRESLADAKISKRATVLRPLAKKSTTNHPYAISY